MTKTMEGKVALVTGGGSGIGRATALAFARQGAAVTVADVASEGGRETVSMIREFDSDAIFIQCDVTKSGNVQSMVEDVVNTFGHLHIAFNNAGIEGDIGPIVEYPEETWARVINTNLTGIWLCMKYEIDQMLKQGGGTIVNTSSVFGLIGGSGLSAYAASKHGVVGLTKTAALEYATENIRVNAVCPGVIDTAMNERVVAAHPDVGEMLKNMHPMGRLGKADEVAGAVLWLCSDSASFVTGLAVTVDGGWAAH